jgi:hypothetical protein
MYSRIASVKWNIGIRQATASLATIVWLMTVPGWSAPLKGGDGATIKTAIPARNNSKTKLLLEHDAGAKLIDPAVLDAVIRDYSGTYPQGIAVSPTGTDVLVKTISPQLRYGLAIWDIAARRLVARFSSGGDVVRPTWSLDGKSVAFFLLQPGNTTRDLYIWRYASGEPRRVAGVKSYAAPQVTWSPDSTSIGYADPDAGLMIVQIRNEKKGIADVSRIFSDEPSVFEWSPDSRSVILFPPDNKALIHLGVDGHQLHNIPLAPGELGRGLLWSGNQNRILVRTKGSRAGYTRLASLDTSNWQLTTVAELSGDVRTPQWTQDGLGIVYSLQKEWGRDIFYLRLGSQTPEQLTELDGWSDLWSNVPFGPDMIPFGHFSDESPELRAVSLHSKRDVLLYRDPSNGLPHTQGIRVTAEPSTGRQLAGVLWKPEGPAKGLIVELHNVSGAATLSLHAYDADYRRKALMANQYGFAYLCVDAYSDDFLKNPKTEINLHYGDYLARLVGSIQKATDVQPSNTMLVAYSVGAAAALSWIVDGSSEYGWATLVGLSDERAMEFEGTLPLGAETRVIAVEASLDPEGTASGLAAIRSDLSAIGVKDRNIATLSVDDVHLLIHPTSWITIEAAIFSALKGYGTNREAIR